MKKIMRIINFLLLVTICFSFNISALAATVEESCDETKVVSERSTSGYNYSGVPGTKSGTYYLGCFNVEGAATVNVNAGGVGNASKYRVVNASTDAVILSWRAVGSGAHTFETNGYCQIELDYGTASGTITINVY